MVSPSLALIIDTCLEAAHGMPLAKQAELYTALADFCGDPNKSAELVQLAEDLRAAERRCHEFVFSVQHPPRKKGDGR